LAQQLFIKAGKKNEKFLLYINAMHFVYTGCFIMFSVITNIYNKETKGPTLMELFTATGKLFFFTTRDDRCVHNG
jgi:hypothetical protein